MNVSRSSRLVRRAAVVAAAALLAAGCSDDGGGDVRDVTTTTAALLVGDGRCDDPTGDVYEATDPDASPTGLAPGLDLVVATAEIDDEELRLRFETVEAIQPSDLPEVVAFGGRPEDDGRFEVRAVRGFDGWAVRVVTFDGDVPSVASVAATVEAHGTVVELALPVGLLPPMGEFISFAYASTGTVDEVPVNDECFPFSGRTPVGG